MISSSSVRRSFTLSFWRLTIWTPPNEEKEDSAQPELTDLFVCFKFFLLKAAEYYLQRIIYPTVFQKRDLNKFFRYKFLNSSHDFFSTAKREIIVISSIY